jgi:uncharacterized membrane protein (DUF106 family)
MMEWVYLHVLVPVLDVLYIPCDWILGATSHLPPIASITIVGVISGVAMALVLKYCSDQKFLGQAKADLNLLKQKMKAAKKAKDTDGLARARALSGRIGGKFMGASLKPSLWTVPIMAVLGLWTGSRLGYLPIRPGEEVVVKAHFEDNAKGFAYVVPGDRVKGVDPLIAHIEIPADGDGLQARWKLRAEAEGNATLTIRHDDRAYSIPFPVARSGGRPPEPVTTLNGPSKMHDQLQAVEIKLTPSLPEAWWNLTWQWGGLYMLVTLAVALGLRYLLKIN